jgi:enoyl-CoA hydratase/carnithine racemase
MVEVEMTDPDRRVEIDRRSGVAAIRLKTPILSRAVLDELYSSLQSLAAEPEPAPLVLCSTHPSVFLAGADLGEIANLDARSSAPYARQGRRVVERFESHPAPTIAAVNGTCSGGGFDIALACDLLVAGEGARFSHPGIQRGLITGWSGTARLPAAVGTTGARSVLLEGREIDAGFLETFTAVRRVTGDPLEIAIESAAEQAALDPIRRRLWRMLRSPCFIDRFHASVVHKL